MKVVFSTIAYSALLAETYEKIKTETGGVFLGAYQDGVWYIVETIDPGPKSIFRQDYFEYDQSYTAHLINKRARLYQYNLTLIGLWHRHPGSFDIFSSTDDGTNATYAKIRPEGAISLLVNMDPVFRLSVFHVGLEASGRPRYTQLSYAVGDEKIPHEILELKKADDLQGKIDALSIRKYGMRQYLSWLSQDFQEVSIPRQYESDEYSLTPENEPNSDPGVIAETRNDIINAIIDDLSYLSDVLGFKTSAIWNGGDLKILEVGPSGKRMHIFSFIYIRELKQCGIEFNGRIYLHRPDMFSAKKHPAVPMASARHGIYTYTENQNVPEGAYDTSNPPQEHEPIRKGIYEVLHNMFNNKEKG